MAQSSTCSPLPSAQALLAPAQATPGFSVGALEPGTLLQTPQGPGERLCSGPVLPKAAPSPRAGRKASVPLLHLLARGPGPCPVAHAHSPGARPALRQPQPSACGSSALLEIIASFLLLLLLLLQSPPQPDGRSQRFSLCPRTPRALPFTAGVRMALPRSPPGAGPVLNVSLAATSPSLWIGAGSGRERRGEERPSAPRDGSWRSWKKQVCSQPSSHQHLMPRCCCALTRGAAWGSLCRPGRGLRALVAFPCTITGFPGAGLSSLEQWPGCGWLARMSPP